MKFLFFLKKKQNLYCHLTRLLLCWSGKWFLHAGRVPKGAVPTRLEGGVRALLCWLHQERPLRRFLRRCQGCAGHRRGMGEANLHKMMTTMMMTMDAHQLTSSLMTIVDLSCMDLLRRPTDRYLAIMHSMFSKKCKNLRWCGQELPQAQIQKPKETEEKRASGSRSKTGERSEPRGRLGDRKKAGLCARASCRAQILLYPMGPYIHTCVVMYRVFLCSKVVYSSSSASSGLVEC